MADDIPGERWLPIPGYEGRYDVSDHGRVRSWLPWRNTPVPRVLKPYYATARGGYPTVRLQSNQGQEPSACIHRLVMLAFVGPMPDGQEVRHLDGDPTNNRLSNLTYGTSSENARDMVRHGRFNPPFSGVTHCIRGHPFDEKNTYHYTTVRGGPGRACRECKRRDARLRARRLRAEQKKAGHER